MRIRIDIDDDPKTSVSEPAATRLEAPQVSIAAVDAGSAAALARQTGATDAGPAPTIAAVERQLRRGITHMLPTEDATWVGEELTRRFGVGSWQFALSASDANRWVLRLARQLTGRSRVVVHDHCYHGSVDEAIAMLGPDGSVVPVRASVGPQVDVAETTRVVHFNDTAGLEAALADAAVAAVLIAVIGALVAAYLYGQRDAEAPA